MMIILNQRVFIVTGAARLKAKCIVGHENFHRTISLIASVFDHDHRLVFVEKYHQNRLQEEAEHARMQEIIPARLVAKIAKRDLCVKVTAETRNVSCACLTMVTASQCGFNLFLHVLNKKGGGG
jgi:hypothetical protein